jgi:uncharacterized NAD(P)/FAD-binding protein YdhS
MSKWQSQQSPTRRSRSARIVVVGGGFSGTMTAVNIARLTEHPLHITVVNDRGPVGRGVAYGLRRPEYLLNVAARNMSAFPHEPDHFLDWLRTRAEFELTPEIELRERFVARQIYGDYLRSIAQHHLQSPGEGALASSELVSGEAVDIESGEHGCRVRLADGTAIEADRVVLATGNEPPAPLPGAEELTDHPAWVANPWQAWEHRLPHHDGSVVLLGTGLTTVDAIITLRALGWLGTVHAVSRHGWFPHPHFRGIEYPEFPPADVDLAALGLERLLTATRSMLLQNLLRRGTIAPDTTDLGIYVDADHTVLTSAGERSPWLLALGPLLRGTYWETIAVPELRVQARRVAETVLGGARAEQESQLQLEYMI